MILRRIGPVSAAKISAALYALMGLIAGAFISLFSLIGSAFAPHQAGLGGVLFGAGALVALPIFYGVFGFIATLIAAALYNVLAGWLGGMELDLVMEPRPGATYGNAADPLGPRLG
jgi:hypothetical protein